MPLVHYIIVVALIGLMLWAANTYVPGYPTIKKIMNVFVCIAVVLWSLQVFGIVGSLNTVRTPYFGR